MAIPTITSHYNKYWGYSPTVNATGGYSDLMYVNLSGVQNRGYHVPNNPETPHYFYRTYINGSLVGGLWYFPWESETYTTGISLALLEPNVSHTVTIEEVLTLDTGGDTILDTTMGVEYSFVILQPYKPVIVSPTNAQTDVVWDDVLTWTDGGNAEQYQVFMSKVSDYAGYPYSLYRGRMTGWANLEGNGWPGTSYTLRTNNTDRYEGFNDYDQIDPYYNTTVYWRTDAYSEWGYAIGDVFSFTIAAEGYVAPPDPLEPFPPSCCSVVENDSFWQPGVWSGDVYTDPYWGSGYVATGGGRWGRQLVVAGDNSVYYEELT